MSSYRNSSSRHSNNHSYRNRSRSSRNDAKRTSNTNNYDSYRRDSSKHYENKSIRKESRFSNDEYNQRRHFHKNDENFDFRNSRKNLKSENMRIKNEPINQQLSCLKSEPKRPSSKSPLKRRNIDDDFNPCETQNSPSKRIKESIDVRNIKHFGLASFKSPKKIRSSSLCASMTDKKYASTPKSERRIHSTRVKEMIEQNSIAMERNMSNNWADILEELEEQTKEAEKYVEKVSTKFNIEKERLLKNLEIDPETLRKRQKRVNYGKVTTEYQKYILQVPRKKRESFHPKTPNKFRKCSRRKFDGQIKMWRKLLHAWDEDPEQLLDMNFDEASDNDITDDFGGASNVGSGISGYNIDDFDILDSDNDEKLTTDTPMEAF